MVWSVKNDGLENGKVLSTKPLTVWFDSGKGFCQGLNISILRYSLDAFSDWHRFPNWFWAREKRVRSRKGKTNDSKDEKEPI
jgi:hypothetical protein